MTSQYYKLWLFDDDAEAWYEVDRFTGMSLGRSLNEIPTVSLTAYVTSSSVQDLMTNDRLFRVTKNDSTDGTDGTFLFTGVLDRAESDDQSAIDAYNNKPVTYELRGKGLEREMLSKVFDNEEQHEGNVRSIIMGEQRGYASPHDKVGNLYLNESDDGLSNVSRQDKFQTGYGFDGSNGYLYSGSLDLKFGGSHGGDLTILFAFHRNSDGSVDPLLGWTSSAGTSQSDNDQYYLEIEPSNNGNVLRYRHQYGSNNSVTFTSSNGIPPGFHVLTLSRDDAEQTIEINVDGDTFIDETYSNSPDGGGDGECYIGHDDGNRYLDGHVYGARFWDIPKPLGVLTEYTSGSGPIGLLGDEQTWFPMGLYEGSPKLSLDDTTNNNIHLRREHPIGTRESAEPKWGIGIEADGSDGEAVGHDDQLRITGDLSIAVIFERDASGVEHGILGWTGTTSTTGTDRTNTLYELSVNASDELVFRHEGDGGAQTVQVGNVPTGLNRVWVYRDLQEDDLTVSINGNEYTSNINITPKGGEDGYFTLGAAHDLDGNGNVTRDVLDGSANYGQIWDDSEPKATLRTITRPREEIRGPGSASGGLSSTTVAQWRIDERPTPVLEQLEEQEGARNVVGGAIDTGEEQVVRVRNENVRDFLYDLAMTGSSGSPRFEDYISIDTTTGVSETAEPPSPNPTADETFNYSLTGDLTIEPAGTLTNKDYSLAGDLTIEPSGTFISKSYPLTGDVTVEPSGTQTSKTYTLNPTLDINP